MPRTIAKWYGGRPWRVIGNEKNTEVERKERMESVERMRLIPEIQNKRGEFSKM